MSTEKYAEDMTNDFEAPDIVEAVVEPVSAETVELVPAEEAALAYGTSQELTFAEKIELARSVSNFQSIWNAVRDGDELELQVKKIICVNTDITDKETGEVIGKHRSIFITTDGDAWGSTSDAVYSTVETIASIFGDPEGWEEPIAIKFRKERSSNNLEFVNVIF